MRIGYVIDPKWGAFDGPMPTPQRAAETMEAMLTEALVAEKAGFHSVQFGDCHGRTECYWPGPLPLMTLAARETQRIMLGVYSLVATLYHPMHAAEQLTVIDNISRGRLVSALSRGYQASYWEQFGVPQEKLLGRQIEFIKVLQLAFTGERFDFAGKHYTVENGLLAPGPYQEGGWPIWGGGNASEAAIRRSAAYGECMTCDPFPVRTDVWERQTGLYREYARELGKQPFVVLMRDGWVADSFEDAARDFGDHLASEARYYLRKGIFVNHPDLLTEESITAASLQPHLVLGSPQQCIETLERLREELDVDYFVMRLRTPEVPSDYAVVHEQIMRFGEEVVQPIHRRYSAPDQPAIPSACRW